MSPYMYRLMEQQIFRDGFKSVNMWNILDVENQKC